MCDKYGIPKDRNHIIGHGEWQNSAWVNWAVSKGYPATFGTCNSHTDPGPNWDWGFFMQLITGDSTAPRVTSQPPAGRVQVFDAISVTFNQRMERAGTEQGFSISPTVPGSLAWKDNFRTLQFIPSMPFLFDTVYTVTIDTSAHNYFGAKLDVNGDGIGGEVYGFSFRTVAHDTIPPTLVATYPAASQSDISSTILFEVEVSEPMDPTTLSGSFELRDSIGNLMPLTTPATQSTGTGVRISFRPVAALQALSSYTLSVLPSMKDYGGNTILSTRTVPFSTGPDQVFNGTVINNLDAAGNWWQPGTSGSTVGTTTTSFAIDTEIKKTGTGSGKVTYVFAGSAGGVVREYNSSKPTVDPGPYVASWVFGDNSRNALEYWFYPGASGSSYTGILVDTLNWTGWKLVATSIAPVPTTAARQFAGFVIKQLSGGRTSGTVYFDDLGVGQGVTSAGGALPEIPVAFALLQNYPNPFNPATSIRYQVPEVSDVKLVVYDILGREVATLVDTRKPVGNYTVQFDAAGLASGVYLYRLQAGSFVQTRKMVLVK
jgi:hypothetical protein